MGDGPTLLFTGILAIISIKPDKQKATLGINFMGGQSWVNCSKEYAAKLNESGAKGSLVRVETEAYSRDGAWKAGDLINLEPAQKASKKAAA